MILLKKFLEDELKIRDDNIFRRFEEYNSLLLEWNSKINLISRNSESIEVQVLNSIFFLTKYKFPAQCFIADIGTGGGFPGIPLKIIFPEIRLVLMDSIQKKMNAVKDISGRLKFDKTEVFCGRAETFLGLNPSYKNKFDIVTAKSVAVLDKLYSWTKNFTNQNGEMIFIKGGDVSGEIGLLKSKDKNISAEIIKYSFDSVYGIEDKKIVRIKKT
jgi:16S rRNA (guanine527-N7)-methyltransferase